MTQVAGRYPGVDAMTYAVLTDTLGVMPSTAVIRFLQQDTFPADSGNLVVSYNGEAVTWVNAVISEISMRGDVEDGFESKAVLFDRREFWKRTAISGVYNERRANGSIVPATEKTIHQLAVLLLTAMGEGAYDISALPNVTIDKPEIAWRCTNPAYELERICNERGCSVSINRQTNQVVIRRIGVGTDISFPSDLNMISYGAEIGRPPQTLLICGANTVWQARFLLEAVAKETDGSLVPIDSVSYAPGTGWGGVDPNTLAGAGLVGGSNEEQLALSSVFRLYRIKAFADDTLDLPGTDIELDAISQCFPVNTHLIELDSEGEKQRFVIRGQFANRLVSGDGAEKKGNTVCEILEVPGNLNTYTGVIEFSTPVYKINLDAFEEAVLYLETSFSVRSNTTGQYLYYTRGLSMGGTGVHPIVRTDLERRLVADYTNCNTIDTVSDNLESLDEEADEILDNASTGFQSRSASQKGFRGIKPISCDGLNRQIQWSVTLQAGADTVVAQNSEPLIGALRWHERMRLQNLDKLHREGEVNRTQMRLFREQKGSIRK